LVAHNLFREDLYYRLAVLQIPIPPLRQRGSDIIELAKHFAGQIARQQHKEIPEFSDEAIFYLLKYHWPGNVRQLENVLLCAVTANRDGIIKPDDFPLEIMEACTHNNSTTDKTSVELTSIPGSLSLKEMEKIAIIQALQQVNFNITQAARILGMSKSTLYRKINAYNLLESIRSDN
jgi:DNA-binding NtrC family response regulator